MAKFLSNGTLVQVSTDNGVIYTELNCQLSGFTGPASTAAEVDVTSLCSTGKEFIGALPDNGSLTLTGFFDPGHAGVAILRTLSVSRDVVDWKIIWNDTGTTNWDFDGYVSEFTPSANQNEALGLSVSVRVSGAITET